jgi:hypothetical protein
VLHCGHGVEYSSTKACCLYVVSSYQRVITMQYTATDECHMLGCDITVCMLSDSRLKAACESTTHCSRNIHKSLLCTCALRCSGLSLNVCQCFTLRSSLVCRCDRVYVGRLLYTEVSYLLAPRANCASNMYVHSNVTACCLAAALTDTMPMCDPNTASTRIVREHVLYTIPTPTYRCCYLYSETQLAQYV